MMVHLSIAVKRELSEHDVDYNTIRTFEFANLLDEEDPVDGQCANLSTVLPVTCQAQCPLEVLPFETLTLVTHKY